MARNRKRAKERRPAQRRATVPGAAATSGGELASADLAPNPLEHAAPDAELAEAQLALGRPELVEDLDPGEERELEQLAGGTRERARGDDLSVAAAAAPATVQRPAARLVGFLRGSWAELQRVQWPDRRQVMQATGVVIGFVIVAGAFLGLADLAAGKLVGFILK